MLSSFFLTFKFCTHVLRISSGDLNGEEREEDVEYLLSRWKQHLCSNFANSCSFSLFLFCSLLTTFCYSYYYNYYYLYFTTAICVHVHQMISKHQDCPMTMYHHPTMTGWTKVLVVLPLALLTGLRLFQTKALAQERPGESLLSVWRSSKHNLSKGQSQVLLCWK